MKAFSSNFDSIQLDFNKLCQTTGWYNNCGLNCLAHFLFDKLSKMSTLELEQFLNSNQQYRALLDTFHEYYNLTDRYNWRDVLNLLNAYPVPTDKEAIFAPVLRQHLAKTLNKYSQRIWQEAVVAISDYVKTGEKQDIAIPIYQANKEFFDNLRAQFLEAMEQANSVPMSETERKNAIQALQHRNSSSTNIPIQINEQNILNHAIFSRKDKILDRLLPQAEGYWYRQGCKNYAECSANLENAVMISANILQLFSMDFNINLYIYTPDSIVEALENPELLKRTGGGQGNPHTNLKWDFKIYNSGLHWQFEVSDQMLAAAHNRHYPSEFNADEFHANEKLSGKFKIYGGSCNKQDVVNCVQNHFHLVKQAENNRLSQASQTTVHARHSVIPKRQSIQREETLSIQEQRDLELAMQLSKEEERKKTLTPLSKEEERQIESAMRLSAEEQKQKRAAFQPLPQKDPVEKSKIHEKISHSLKEKHEIAFIHEANRNPAAVELLNKFNNEDILRLQEYLHEEIVVSMIRNNLILDFLDDFTSSPEWYTIHKSATEKTSKQTLPLFDMETKATINEEIFKLFQEKYEIQFINEVSRNPATIAALNKFKNEDILRLKVLLQKEFVEHLIESNSIELFLEDIVACPEFYAFDQEASTSPKFH